jgi:hypothetical protein
MAVNLPQYDPEDPEGSYNALVRILEQFFDDFIEGSEKTVTKAKLSQHLQDVVTYVEGIM